MEYSEAIILLVMQERYLHTRFELIRERYCLYVSRTIVTNYNIMLDDLLALLHIHYSTLCIAKTRSESQYIRVELWT